MGEEMLGKSIDRMSMNRGTVRKAWPEYIEKMLKLNY